MFRVWEANENGKTKIQKYVADELDVEIEYYLIFSNSLHIYGNIIFQVKEMFKYIMSRNEWLDNFILELTTFFCNSP